MQTEQDFASSIRMWDVLRAAIKRACLLNRLRVLACQKAQVERHMATARRHMAEDETEYKRWASQHYDEKMYVLRKLADMSKEGL
ncbi:MAG: hypothetical protein ABS43_03650 [Bordetella sp. SCN 67-23]|nr:hypothetical protein [Burkholderiales bacterium]ODS75896.1 MAG: hypothetical protein ABS43_03650 [Bordetella sp. SCN 67-23]OJW91772.1 MAG: hypothetical protein BGO71_21680 [Burkholderiales bacterium 67-32]